MLDNSYIEKYNKSIGRKGKNKDKKTNEKNENEHSSIDSTDIIPSTLLNQLPTCVRSISHPKQHLLSSAASLISSESHSIPETFSSTSDNALSLINTINNSISTTTSRQSNNKDKKNKNHSKKNRRNGNNPISSAMLTEDGLLIKSNEQNTKKKNRSTTPYSLMKNHSNSNSIVTLDTSTTSFRSSTESQFETASLISCVTCLSDTPGNNSSSLNSTISSNINENGNANDAHNHHRHHTSSINGQLPNNVVIPYGRILNAKYVDEMDKENRYKIPKNGSRLVEITFAKPRRHDVIPKCLTLLIEPLNSQSHTYLYSQTQAQTREEEEEEATSMEHDIIEEIFKRSYKNTKRKRSILVIINPFGGKRKAKKLFMTKARPLLLASDCFLEVHYTKYVGHAIEIAKEMDIDKFDTIACASGDGIPHEVINGLYRREDRVKAFNKLTITQIPCGSGNAMSVSCHWTNNPSYATLCLIKSVEVKVDVMCCSQPSYVDEHPKLSFLSQTYGVIADSDINTESFRWMGSARFELGVAFNILQRKKYPCDIYVKYAAKSKNELRSYYLEHKRKNHDYLNDSYNFRYELEEQQTGSIYANDDAIIDGMTDIDDNYNDEHDDTVTEEDFKIKYPYKDGIPDDWERIDSKITDNLGIFYSGKMPYVAADTKFFPAALPSDGAIDMVITDSRTPFTRMAPILLALDRGTHVLQPEVLHSKIKAYKIIPKVSNGLFAIDGEKFPLEPLQVEIMPKLCKTLLRNGSFVDTEFDSM
ncbi:sphinganine kinase LCB5 NDAI_0I02370 [Naumovozyma dairenensis CBS 421]|uniref:sphingosine kinase n=1 Tax=Naumovozyma dairenensis (strain ATCC 10597 / BCRC 20456 / CBS 421 / NBRC 0211 / NRRL Y-12639) TaxID=1071378 RepID=G0WG94_NAUDC|nr:hypothetical protein NDAI_0I02370 [Naumovozyma dairenensis CBS 421]CCD26805.1 hypothetical protein NDAI_0I02370 [Naumovozyma dairenensis CBS 421]